MSTKSSKTRKTSSRNLILLCDGTSNEIKADRTNVLRLFQAAIKSDEDIVFYDPGVGTVGAYSNWSRWWVKAKEIMGLAFGKGLDDNVLDAYHFLVNNWREGDRIYLFGFSRGAYTVRVLAGLIYTIGILKPQQGNLKRYTLQTLKQASIKGDFDTLGIYQETLERKPVEIEFLGIWDTVGSVFLWIKGWFRIHNIGYTRRNHAVKTIRHALAIDERRRFFRHQDWKPHQKHTTYLPHQSEFYDGDFPDQDVEEVWFAGVHGDSGGGYRDADSQVPKIAFEWLAREAQHAGMAIDETKMDIFLGKAPDTEGNYQTKPDPLGEMHNSLNWAWWIIEFFPKWRNFDLSNLASWFDFYIPLGERRTIPNKDAKPGDKILVHDSVKLRLEKTDYAAPNLPDTSKVKWISTKAD